MQHQYEDPLSQLLRNVLGNVFQEDDGGDDDDHPSSRPTSCPGRPGTSQTRRPDMAEMWTDMMSSFCQAQTQGDQTECQSEGEGASRPRNQAEMWQSLLGELFQCGNERQQQQQQHQQQQQQQRPSSKDEDTAPAADDQAKDFWNFMAGFAQRRQTCQTDGASRHHQPPSEMPPFLQMLHHMGSPRGFCRGRPNGKPQPWERVIDVSNLDLDSIELQADDVDGQLVVTGVALTSQAVTEGDQVVKQVELPEGVIRSSVRYYLSDGNVYITGLKTRATPTNQSPAGESTTRGQENLTKETEQENGRESVRDRQMSKPEPTEAEKLESQTPSVEATEAAHEAMANQGTWTNLSEYKKCDIKHKPPVDQVPTSVQRGSPGPDDEMETHRTQNNDSRMLAAETQADLELEEIPSGSADSFEKTFDLTGFTPSEITVKLHGRTLAISAEHNEEADDFVDFRQFRQSVTLPDDVILDEVASRLDDGGILKVRAPRMTSGDSTGQIVAIQRQ